MDVHDFHRSLPGYAPTPLTPVADLATELGVGAVFVKDESDRLGLPAFKILGASYAISRAVSARLGRPSAAYPLDELRARIAGSTVSLVAATDGNHGRAVARVAHLLGISAAIYVPTEVSEAAKDAIRAEGAHLVELAVPYDAVVVHAAAVSGGDAVLIQDTSWEDYRDIPQWIVAGYDTLLAEVDEQLENAGCDRVDLVVVPAGVGSFAQAVVAHYRTNGHRPALMVVEPDTAASVTSSLNTGQICPVPTGDTVMTGLNCGTVSEIAWPVLSSGLDASVTVTDRDALDAMNALDAFGIDAGPCGAATLAGARRVLADPERRTQLGVGNDAVVVLLNTEGRAANPKTFAR
ncbi:diaminopropionate ammonia-lyase [Microbacterium rhizomatis]|uniref:Diaminopropionate ammonia-lyase n=1 Tax=Microbacterium rhizomatis TaxID=1631477 RepID=A0A5J5IW21_9MICO|nr:diaminopropionate ammonia-lyase [Microbacterium rhizomatis]